jgi:hypothetical protein
MRFSAGNIANAAAWAVVLGLVAVAIVLVNLWGPFGLIILGLLTLLICTRFSLYDQTPTWGTEVFRARMASHGSPEQRAAMQAERHANEAPVRFYRWCGVVLLVAGVAGFAWQMWR